MFPKFLNATVTKQELEYYFDATYERRTKYVIKGERSLKFDNATWISYYLWLYLVKNRKLTGEEARNTQQFNNAFDRFGGPESAIEIPRIAHNNFLDLFTTTRP